MHFCYTTKMIKAIIFDCFGVLLVDSRQSLIDEFPEKKRELLDFRAQADRGHMSRKELLEAFSEVTGLTTEAVDQQLCSEHTLNRPLVRYIKELRTQGYKVAMLSNLGRGWFHELVPYDEAIALFDDIVISGEVGMVKPQPEIYQLACDNLSVESQDVVFVDDIERNCAGAEAVGMKSIFYKDFEQFQLQAERLLK